MEKSKNEYTLMTQKEIATFFEILFLHILTYYYLEYMYMEYIIRQSIKSIT